MSPLFKGGLIGLAGTVDTVTYFSRCIYLYGAFGYSGLNAPPTFSHPGGFDRDCNPSSLASLGSQASPAPRFRTYIVDGIKQGFRVGFDYTRPLCSARSDMSSSRQFPQIISQYLAEECAEGRIVGPLPGDFVNNVQVKSVWPNSEEIAR